jgi:sulfoxide reductase heme-binding subunit YedZ
MFDALMQWYVLRGTGTVLMALLTLSTAMGVMSTARAGNATWPRFATQALHRNVSLLTMAMLAAHVVVAIIDEAADVSWHEAFIPRIGTWTGYWDHKGFWLSLGIFANDVMIAIVITSLLRHRMSHRFWRSLHIAAYGSWAFGLLHGVGIGTDTTTTWEMSITVASVGVVAAVAVIRLATLSHERRLAA